MPELQRRDDRRRAWEHPHRRYVLPAIQREFVWGTDRMCALFDSLMRDYPISSLLYWRVDHHPVIRDRIAVAEGWSGKVLAIG